MSLEGASCADLPGFVVDKYFDCDAGREPLKAMVAKAICRNCVVLDECRSEALSMPRLPDRGVLGGASVTEVEAARHWRLFEQGLRETAPVRLRPTWLAMPDATYDTERMRLGDDPEESEFTPIVDLADLSSQRKVQASMRERA